MLMLMLTPPLRLKQTLTLKPMLMLMLTPLLRLTLTLTQSLMRLLTETQKVKHIAS